MNIHIKIINKRTILLPHYRERRWPETLSAILTSCTTIYSPYIVTYIVLPAGLSERKKGLLTIVVRSLFGYIGILFD